MLRETLSLLLCRSAWIVLLFVAAAAVTRADEPPSGSAQEDPFESRRQRMVERQLRARGVKDERVLKAMATVKRHHLVPDRHRSQAYADTPLPIGLGQTISQPYIVALMTERLGLSPNDRVLEVGTGSGYQASVLAEIVKEVHTIEIFRTLHERAKKNLGELGYRNVRFRHGDGNLGWPEAAPFDAIIVTCAASHVPPALVEQLKPGARMCIPVGPPFGSQRLLLVTKSEEGDVSTRTLTGVSFVPLLSPRDVQRDEAPPAEPKKPSEDGKGADPEES